MPSTNLDFLKDFARDGFSMSTRLIDPSGLPDFHQLATNGAELFFEKDGKTLRSIYGFQQNPVFKEWLSNQTLIQEIVTSLLGKEVYLHQTKVNLKNRGESSVWPFHRDFPFWHVFDNIVHNQLLNVVVYLDDVTENSGDLKFIPRSHLEFLPREAFESKTEYSLAGSASDDLLFSFSAAEVDYFTQQYGLIGTAGPAGSVVVFNPDTLHGSGKSNLDFSRKIMILTFNRCDNCPSTPSPRPEYLCSTHTGPIFW